MAEKKCERRRFLFEVALERMVHVGDAGPYRIEGLERPHQRAGRKHLDLDAPAGGGADGLRKADRAGVQARHVSGQSVTIFSCRFPCAIAGAGKLTVAPAANDPAPARRSRRLMAATFLR